MVEGRLIRCSVSFVPTSFGRGQRFVLNFNRKVRAWFELFETACKPEGSASASASACVCVLPIIFQSILWKIFLHHHVHPPSRTYCIQVPQASTEHVVACESGVCLCMVWVCGCVYVVVCAVVWLCVCVRVCVHVHACVLMRPHAQCVDVFVCACVDLLNTSPTHKNPRINYVLCLFPPPLSLAPFLARLCVSRFA